MVSPFILIIPTAPTFAAVSAAEIGVYALFLFLLIFPHWLAAKLLAPKPSLFQVLGAVLLQFVLMIVGFALLFFGVILAGSAGTLLAALVATVIASAATGGIYGFGIGRGFVYNILVGLIIGGMGLVFNLVTGDGADTLARLRKPFDKQKKVDAAEEVGPKDSGKPDKAFVLVQQFNSVSEAQQAAIARYPDLGKAGTVFNQRFLDLHSGYKLMNDPMLANPNWPMRIAEEVAKSLGMP